MIQQDVIRCTKKIFTLLLLIPIACSCEDFLKVPSPGTQLMQESVFRDDDTAIAAMASIYAKLSDGGSFADGFNNSITFFEGLYSDELTSFISVTSTSPRVEFYFSNVSPLNGIVSATWSNCYKIIYECNRIVEGLNGSTSLTSSVKNQLLGEALVIRSFCYFYLVNLFGDVPLIKTSDYRINSKMSRTPTTELYLSIISDLTSAKKMLSDDYPTQERVRVNKGAAIALLARVYLYAGYYPEAEAESTEIINKAPQYELLVNLNLVFLKNSKEAIWQLIPRAGMQNYTNEGFLFILLAPPTNIALRTQFYKSFEASDLRRKDWIDSLNSDSGLTTWYFAHKYKERNSNATGAEYSMVFRLAEQYLIRAEARALQNKLTGSNGAESDINIIRNRAGLSNTVAFSRDQLLSIIEHERSTELFTEWGHRFFDLKRTGRAHKILAPLKSNWDSTDVLLPLPQNEILLNPNLKPQNPGY